MVRMKKFGRNDKSVTYHDNRVVIVLLVVAKYVAKVGISIRRAM